MEVVIVTNGDIKDIKFLKDLIKEASYIICADGAGKYLKQLNIYPDLLVGDLDSIDKESLKWIKENNIRIEQFPKIKDMTDTELAVDFALGLGPSKITLVGAVGSRLDHSLSNIMLLYKIHKMGITPFLVDEVNYASITSSRLEMECRVGQTLSIIPIAGDGKGISLEGLEYPLKDQTIKMGSSLGISNRCIDKNIVISIKEGTLLVVKISYK